MPRSSSNSKNLVLINFILFVVLSITTLLFLTVSFSRDVSWSAFKTADNDSSNSFNCFLSLQGIKLKLDVSDFKRSNFYSWDDVLDSVDFFGFHLITPDAIEDCKDATTTIKTTSSISVVISALLLITAVVNWYFHIFNNRVALVFLIIGACIGSVLAISSVIVWATLCNNKIYNAIHEVGKEKWYLSNISNSYQA